MSEIEEMKGKRIYVISLTCVSTRTVHLELEIVQDFTAESFLLDLPAENHYLERCYQILHPLMSWQQWIIETI